MSVEKQNTLPYPVKGVVSGRFKVIDHIDQKMIVLWDMGDYFQPKKVPQVWACYEYWNDESRERAVTRLRVVTGILNGSRDKSDLIRTP